MKPRWHIHRRMTPLPDGQRRWDQAYQWLLEWSRCPAAPPPNPEQEAQDDANCRVCAGIDPEPSPPADH